MKLLIDIGNTRLKWALLDDNNVFGDRGAIAHHGAPAQAVMQLPAAGIAACWIAHVTGAGHEDDLIAAVRSRYAVAPQFARSAAAWRGLHSAYREPQRLGVDRWLAMIAAWQMHRGGACVVDAGTALTVDVVSADGCHQGGIIAAGVQAQLRAVLGATRFATGDLDLSDRRPLLGRDTESCVRQGALLACAGAVERASATLGADALRLITGGDAERLLPLLPATWQHRPLLVLEGLAALSRD